MLTLNQKINKIKDDISFINKLELDVCGNAYFRKNLIVDNSLIVQDLDIYEKLIDLSNNGMSGIFEPSGNTYYYDSTPIGIGTSDVNENFSLTISGGLYLSGNNSSSMNYTDTSWLRDTSDNVYITHVNTLGIGVKYNDLSFNNKLDVSGNSYFRNNLIVDNSLIVQDLDIYEKLIDLSNNGGGDVTQQELATKQDVLTAGTNITIVGNTISSAGGTLPADVNFSSVNTSTLNTSTINTSGRVDIGNAGGQSEGLVLTGNGATITFKETSANQRSGMIHMNDSRMYFLSGASNSEAWTRVNGQWPLILHTDSNRAQFGGQLDCDLDAFHYSAGDNTITKGTGADLSWTSTRRGSTIKNGDSFRPKYTGKYSITLCIFFTAGSSGLVKVSLKLNGSEYNLNGGAYGTNLISADTTNRNGNIFMGNMIVDAVAGQDIKAYVYTGTLRYYGGVSYLAGYYIGNT